MPRINVLNVVSLLALAAVATTAASGERKETLDSSRISSFADGVHSTGIATLGINGTGKSLGINGTGK